jgi:ribosome-binding protein aMBF1 (putative translation factor)
MVFGKKCKLCGKDANVHKHPVTFAGKVLEPELWLCARCDSAIADLKYVAYEMEKA